MNAQQSCSTCHSKPAPVMYRKKATALVAAHRWWTNGNHPDDNIGEQMFDMSNGKPYHRVEGAVVRFFRRPDVPGDRPCRTEPSCGNTMERHGWIDTLEGGHIVCPGDWILTGVRGERWPCKPDIFEETYEKVEEVATCGKRPPVCRCIKGRARSTS